MKTAEFGVPCKAPERGVCRICGCTNFTVCAVEVPGHGMQSERDCYWVDETQTLCDAPSCVVAAKAELGFQR